MQTFAVEIPLHDPKRMEKFQEMMDRLHDETVSYIKELANTLGVSEGCAANVWYLRTRKRHTLELEAKLIELHREGNPPNMCDFGV